MYADSTDRNMQSQEKLSYIQGIRGIAILLVVFFHLLPQVCPAGYMGVDVFFIISGYFLIGRQLKAGAEFRLYEFLKKKGVRLLIPYYALMVFVFAVSVVLLPAVGMIQVNEPAAACLTARGNVFLDSLTGNYFSTDTRTFPLMHLWYMGVLLQCYLFFALLFVVWSLCRCGGKARIICVSLLGLLSFAVAYLRLTPIPWEYAKDTYYWTSARIWEFALGGLLYTLPAPQSRKGAAAAAGAALAVLLGCSLLPVQESAWMILLGAVCGSLLLRYGAQWESCSPLRSTVLVWLGGISFSLYLVHWPCISFCEFILGNRLTIITALPVLTIVMLLALLFYKGVEKPRCPLWVLGLMIAVAAAMQQAIVKTNGFRRYLHRESNQQLEQAMQPEVNVQLFLAQVPADSPLYQDAEGMMPNNFTTAPAPYSVLLQEIGVPEKELSFIVIGDSHAIDFANGMHLAALQKGWHGLFLNSYILPFWDAELPQQTTSALGNFYNRDKATCMLNWLAKHPELHTVFIAQYWGTRMKSHVTWSGEPVTGDMVQARAAELREFCRQLKAIGKEVVVATDTPRIKTITPKQVLCSYLMFPMGKDFPADLTCDKGSYEQANGAFNHELDNIAADGLCIVLHRENAFFKTNTFRAYDGHSISHRDAGHLTPEGGYLSISGVLEQIGTLLPPQAKE